MDFSVHQVSLFIYLIEILCFFVRQHTHHSKYFVLSEKLGQRIAQLLSSPEKYLKLSTYFNPRSRSPFLTFLSSRTEVLP